MCRMVVCASLRRVWSLANAKCCGLSTACVCRPRCGLLMADASLPRTCSRRDPTAPSETASWHRGSLASPTLMGTPAAFFCCNVDGGSAVACRAASAPQPPGGLRRSARASADPTWRCRRGLRTPARGVGVWSQKRSRCRRRRLCAAHAAGGSAPPPHPRATTDHRAVPVSGDLGGAADHYYTVDWCVMLFCLVAWGASAWPMPHAAGTRRSGHVPRTAPRTARRRRGQPDGAAGERPRPPRSRYKRPRGRPLQVPRQFPIPSRLRSPTTTHRHPRHTTRRSAPSPFPVVPGQAATRSLPPCRHRCSLCRHRPTPPAPPP